MAAAAAEEPHTALRCDVLRLIGLELEGLIGTGVGALEGVRHLNEQAIRAHFGDASLNGVDHWISYNGEHILAQTKWKECGATQPEVAQFLACVERIVSRLPATERGSVYLVWICKTEPTRHARTLLSERGVEIVCCAVSVEMLARNVIGWVAETWGLDPVPALQTVPIRRATRVPAGGGGSAAVTERLVGRVEYDETAAGVAARSEMLDFLQLIHDSVVRPLLLAASGCPVMDLRLVLEANLPLDGVGSWTDGRYSRVNYNALLRTVKVVCCPTRSKHVHSSAFRFYCRARFLSTELGRLAQEYMARRGLLQGERSGWARRLPVLTCVPEPMTETEYRGLIVWCVDYTPYIVLREHGGGREMEAHLMEQFRVFYS